MRKSNIININESLLDAPIYRIMPVTRFFQLLDDKKLALLKPKKWDDPFENTLLNSIFLDCDGREGTFASKDSVYGQCWSLHNETDAMWRIYSQNKDGIKISTTPRKLLTALENCVPVYSSVMCFIGAVSYLTYNDILDKFKSIHLMSTDGAGIAESLLYKRLEFEHEKEIRLIYCGEDDKCLDDIFLFDVNPTNLIDSIVFDPRMDKNLKLSYRLGINNKGYNFNEIQSTLYDTPEKIRINIC
ncbi:DUF2971 domain-containing protein [Providencia manganoxydans]|uniref:DUF2971 domain-containing protein n=1 Tax=Providencia manganoxydans TaxID=2923283 RepID=UPI0034E4BF4A